LPIDRDDIPEAAFERVAPATRFACIRLANRATDRVNTAGAGAAAAVNGESVNREVLGYCPDRQRKQSGQTHH